MKINDDDELKINALILKKFENFIIAKSSIIKNLNLKNLISSLTFISFINNEFSTIKNVINVESFFLIIELINNYKSNKESFFFKF